MASKSAFLNIPGFPTAPQIADAAVTYGGTGLAVGGGVAGLQYLASRIAQYKADAAKRQKAQEGNTDVLTVTLPNKTAAGASRMMGSKVMRDLLSSAKQIASGAKKTVSSVPRAAATLGAGTAGAVGLDQYVHSQVSNPQEGALSVIRAALDTGGKGVVQAIKNTPPPPPAPVGKSTLGDLGMWAGFGALGTMAGYGAVNGLTRNHRKQEEQARLEKAKQEYSSLLGQALAGPKTAAVLEYPTIEGLVAGLAEELSPQQKNAEAGDIVRNVLGGPGALAVLSGLVAHHYVYSRATAADKAQQQRQIKPPRSIRLVTAPAAPAPAPEDSEKVAAFVNLEAIDFLIKEAGLEETLREQAMNALSGGAPTPAAPTEPASLKPRIERIDGNTVVIQTVNGPVTVNADDPQAQALLAEKQKQISQAMASASAIPGE